MGEVYRCGTVLLRIADIWKALTILNGSLSGDSGFYHVISNSDDGSHFEHNKRPHKTRCGIVSVQGWPLIQVKITKNPTNIGLLQGGRLMQVTITAFV